MRSKESGRSQLLQGMRSSLFWAGPLLIGSIWLLGASDSGTSIIPVTVCAAAAGRAWRQMRDRASRRQAVLDAYAEREIARIAAHAAQCRAERRLTAI